MKAFCLSLPKTFLTLFQGQMALKESYVLENRGRLSVFLGGFHPAAAGISAFQLSSDAGPQVITQPLGALTQHPCLQKASYCPAVSVMPLKFKSAQLR